MQSQSRPVRLYLALVLSFAQVCPVWANEPGVGPEAEPVSQVSRRGCLRRLGILALTTGAVYTGVQKWRARQRREVVLGIEFSIETPFGNELVQLNSAIELAGLHSPAERASWLKKHGIDTLYLDDRNHTLTRADGGTVSPKDSQRVLTDITNRLEVPAHGVYLHNDVPVILGRGENMGRAFDGRPLVVFTPDAADEPQTWVRAYLQHLLPGRELLRSVTEPRQTFADIRSENARLRQVVGRMIPPELGPEDHSGVRERQGIAELQNLIAARHAQVFDVLCHTVELLDSAALTPIVLKAARLEPRKDWATHVMVHSMDSISSESLALEQDQAMIEGTMTLERSFDPKTVRQLEQLRDFEAITAGLKKALLDFFGMKVIEIPLEPPPAPPRAPDGNTV